MLIVFLTSLRKYIFIIYIVISNIFVLNPKLSIAHELVHELEAPKISIANLFDTSVSEGSLIEGKWTLYGVESIRSQYLYFVDHLKEASSTWKGYGSLYFTPIQAITLKPVRLNEESAKFFKELPSDVTRDGSLIGYKYVFYPSYLSSLLSTHSPLIFFAIKRGVNSFQLNYGKKELSFALSDEEEQRIIQSNKDRAIYFATGLQLFRSGNIKDAFSLLEKSSDLGFSIAQLFLGIEFQNDKKPYFNQKRALELFRNASISGNIFSQYYYAKMLENGQGGEQDSLSAIHYYQRIVDFFGRPFNERWAHFIEYGQEILPFAKKRLMFYQLRASSHYEAAQVAFSMGRLPLALKLYRSSAESGLAQAQYRYGNMLAEGKFDKANPQEARKYLSLAADQGHVFAQYYYGLMLLMGVGGEVDREEGLKNIRQAALSKKLQGSPAAEEIKEIKEFTQSK